VGQLPAFAREPTDRVRYGGAGALSQPAT